MSQNYTEDSHNQRELIEVLQWHLDHGADDLLMDVPADRTAMPALLQKTENLKASPPQPAPLSFQPIKPDEDNRSVEMMGAAQAIVEAKKIAASCRTPEELAQAIRDFEGLSVKRTATNMVFCDGNPDAPVMLVGEAPGADEDIQGKPFVGVSGQLLDRILACIGLSRHSEEADKAIYISNILNWRPPGNRTPSTAEIEISLPFIERHIALIQPKALILCGGVSAKALLRSSESISKLRGVFHNYQLPEALVDNSADVIPAMATYHPAYLLRTPAQKKAVWADMLMFQDKIHNI